MKMTKKTRSLRRFATAAFAAAIVSGAVAAVPASARESTFTRSGVGPLYWSTYEYQYTNNGPMDETEWKKNIDWIAAEYKQFGYDLIVSDGWIESAQRTNSNGYILTHNDNWQHDWMYWQRYIASKGMKLGVYYNPLWVTRSAANDPAKKIAGTNIPVSSIANSSDVFNNDLYWVDVNKPGAKEYVQGYVNYFKNMGVKYLRIDFLSWYENGIDKGRVIGKNHGSANYRKALQWMKEAAGDDMELSLVMPHLKSHAANELATGDMVRINEDLARGGWENLSGQRQNWTNGWSQWANPFQGFTGFSDIAGRGSNMIMDGDFLRMNTFKTNEERKSAISLFTLAGSPIAITDQHSTIGNTGSFYKNANMLSLHNQGFVGKPYYYNSKSFSSDPHSRDSERWLGQLPNGNWIVGLFNRSDIKATRSIDYVKDLGLTGSASTKDLWTNESLGSISKHAPALPAHGTSVVEIQPADQAKVSRYEMEVATWVGGAGFNNDHTGYNGYGFVDGFGTAGAKVVVAVEAPADGQYKVNYRYANATGATSTLKASVMNENGSAVQTAKTVSFPAAASWNDWMNKESTLTLKKGVNLVTLQRTAGDAGAINLDYIELYKAASVPLVREGGFETGTLSGWSEWHPAGQEPAYGVDGYDERSGDSKLYFWSMNPFKQSAHQQLTGLSDGTYRVSAYVKETVYGADPATVRMELSADGAEPTYVNIAPKAGYQLVSGTAVVRNGKLTFGFYADSPGRTSLQIDDVTVVKQ
ncbi:carbohydrate-binding protein [Paenibacillus chartarius]|uniref:Carbohydrate-binding protein n=1 Tax=Paenibacillus chartarius TaxID=747481 RepID=A0ABV6DVF7_9BACL